MKRQNKGGGPNQFRLIPILLVVFVCLVVMSGPAFADRILYVDDDAAIGGDGLSWDTAYKYLQDAIAAAQAKDEIRVAQGFYLPDRDSSNPNGTGDREAAFTILDGMSLRGGFAGHGMPDPNTWDPDLYKTVLNGDLAGNDVKVDDPALLENEPTRLDNTTTLVEFSGDRFEAVLLEGCVITNSQGYTSLAGVTGSVDEVTIRDCTFRHNCVLPIEASGWMPIVKLELTRCSFIENAGVSHSPVSVGNAEIVECKFIRNYCRELGAGAAWVWSSSLMNCVFIENRATNGGALYTWLECRVTGCVFQGNQAEETGGAICNTRTLEVLDSVFIGNEAEVVGGACLNLGDLMTLKNCVLIGNQAGERGGVFSTRQAVTLEIIHCTAVGNRAPQGSFLSILDPYLKPRPGGFTAISNSMISSEGCAIWNNDSTVEINYSNIQRSNLVCHDPSQGIIWGSGNTEVDPLLVDPGFWDVNGTPNDVNDDVFVEGDYHLKSQAGHWDNISQTWVQDDVTSLCIDAGDPNSPIGLEPFPNGGRINMGAYGGTIEASKSYFGEPPCEMIIAGDINGDCRVDFADLVILVNHWRSHF